ncbi:hypothetical protein [Fibrobacter sp. UWB11]|uniref:hypothetical protein n=1 Tax=Fibrobacter sp. UWB11 TaxID=1896202 RepID=UPI000928C54E|nr:hypothetical protein [Fibrobacter sp. UWB11]SIN94162.1 hypothetical protein SAMN05720758_0681 [Fibrobacter sp. UWB11]
MKKLSFFTCSAFAAFMFAACSDDPVTGAIPPAGGSGQGGGTVLDSTRNMSLNLKGCYGHPYDALMKTAADNPKAYLVVDEAGYHVVILNITDACGYASVVFNNQRVLDTLKVQFDGSPTDCMCLTDEWFDIDPLDADIKYFVYQRTVYEVVTEPLPVRSSSSATVVSSSSEIALSSAVVESSSSSTPAYSSFVVPVFSSSSVHVESSSSVAPPGPTHHIITDATAQCSAKSRVVDDPWLDGATPVQAIRPKDEDYALPPVALRYAGTERTSFSIENISFACDVTIDTLDVYVIGETVYVNAKMNYDNAKRCLCESKVSFAVDNDPGFWHARWLVLDDGSSINLQNKMDIYDMDVITIDETKPRQEAKNVVVVCKNDRRTADLLGSSNAVLSDVQDVAMDTASNRSTAYMVDDGDGFVTLRLENIQLGCGVKNAEFEVVAYEGVLYVNSKNTGSLYATNCICPSRISLQIEKDSRFTDVDYVVFDNGGSIPLYKTK